MGALLLAAAVSILIVGGHVSAPRAPRHPPAGTHAPSGAVLAYWRPQAARSGGVFRGTRRMTRVVSSGAAPPLYLHTIPDRVNRPDSPTLVFSSGGCAVPGS